MIFQSKYIYQKNNYRIPLFSNRHLLMHTCYVHIFITLINWSRFTRVNPMAHHSGDMKSRVMMATTSMQSTDSVGAFCSLVPILQATEACSTLFDISPSLFWRLILMVKWAAQQGWTVISWDWIGGQTEAGFFG